jgi:hypothetical protein
MIDISFEINGRKVNPNQMGNALEQALLSSIKDEVTQKVRSIRDPKTGERPKIKVKGRSIDSLSFEISGSEDLVARVRKALG